MWSANTWIIVLCVAIFAVDHFTARHSIAWSVRPGQVRTEPAQLVTGGRVYNVPEGISIAPPIVPDFSVPAQPGPRGIPVVPLIDQGSGARIGYIEVYPMNGMISEYLHFSTQRGFRQFEFWRLIGFQFLHANLWHLLVNMIVLYFFGPMIERHLGSKRYLAFYLLCGICGALLYSTLNLGGVMVQMFQGQDVRIPGLLFNDPFTPLIGASAGVFGVLMAGAYLAPNATVLVMFILPMPLKFVAYGLVGLALFMIVTGGHNAGGEAGHLGGAIAGFYFIRRPHHLHGFFDLLGRADPTSHHYRNRPSGKAGRPVASQREIDRILDKISREGIQSLTDREKRILQEASRK